MFSLVCEVEKIFFFESYLDNLGMLGTKREQARSQSLSMYSRGSPIWKQKWICMLKWAGDFTAYGLRVLALMAQEEE